MQLKLPYLVSILGVSQNAECEVHSFCLYGLLMLHMSCHKYTDNGNFCAMGKFKITQCCMLPYTFIQLSSYYDIFNGYNDNGDHSWT